MTPQQIDAMKLALEALQHEADTGNDDAYKLERDAIKEALAQPEQITEKEKISREMTAEIVAMRSQPEQKPVAWMYTSQWKGDERFITRYQSELTTYKADKVWPLYTSAPAQRTWVELTEGAIKILWIQYRAALPRYLCFANAVLAKSKELNT